MRASDQPGVAILARAFDTVARDRFTPDDQEWFARIEDRRRALLDSSERVEVIDHGAGLTTSTRSADEMARGFVSSPRITDICAKASLPPIYGRLLYAIIKEFSVRRGIELGTCLGISAAYQTAPMQRAGTGRFVTCEGAPTLAVVAERNLTDLGLTRCAVVPGRFSDTYRSVLEQQRPIGYAFIDGHHDERATITYIDQLLPYIDDTAVVVLDDISWSAGMARAWDELRERPGVIAAVDLHRMGIIVVGAGSFTGLPEQFRYSMT